MAKSFLTTLVDFFQPQLQESKNMTKSIINQAMTNIGLQDTKTSAGVEVVLQKNFVSGMNLAKLFEDFNETNPKKEQKVSFMQKILTELFSTFLAPPSSVPASGVATPSSVSASGLFRVPPLTINPLTTNTSFLMTDPPSLISSPSSARSDQSGAPAVQPMSVLRRQYPNFDQILQKHPSIMRLQRRMQMIVHS